MKERIRPIACFRDSPGQGRAGQAVRLCKYLAEVPSSLPDPRAQGKATRTLREEKVPYLDCRVPTVHGDL